MIDFVDLKMKIESLGPWAPLAFIFTYAGSNVLCLPTWVFSLTAGAVFGPAWGLLYATIAANLGANASFGIARYFGQAAVSRFLRSRIPRLERPLERNAFEWILGLRLIPIVPFFAVNYGCGLSPIPWSDFALGTLLGMLPMTFIYISTGAVLGVAATGISLRDPRIWKDPRLWALLVAILVVALGIKKFRRR